MRTAQKHSKIFDFLSTSIDKRMLHKHLKTFLNGPTMDQNIHTCIPHIQNMSNFTINEYVLITICSPEKKQEADILTLAFMNIDDAPAYFSPHPNFNRFIVAGGTNVAWNTNFYRMNNAVLSCTIAIFAAPTPTFIGNTKQLSVCWATDFKKCVWFGRKWNAIKCLSDGYQQSKPTRNNFENFSFYCIPTHIAVSSASRNGCDCATRKEHTFLQSGCVH